MILTLNSKSQILMKPLRNPKILQVNPRGMNIRQFRSGDPMDEKASRLGGLNLGFRVWGLGFKV